MNERSEIKDLPEKSKVKRKMADWALQFVWNQPEVSLALSGMSTMQQVIENVESADHSGINTLTEDELQIIRELREVYRKYDVVPCTSCGYCIPCPNGVTIPSVLSLVNALAYWGENGRQRISMFYNRMVKTPDDLEARKVGGEEIEGSACLCVQCGECLDKCPQQIDIPDFMKKANELFEDGKEVSEVLES